MSTHQYSDRERRLLELVRDPLFVTSSDGTSHAANAAGLRMTGLSEEEFLAVEWWELIHEEDRPAAARNLAGIVEHGGTSEPFRIRVLVAGEVRWIEAQSTIDAESGLIYTVVHDITDREEAFMDRLAGAFRDAPLGMALVAPDGRFVRVNSTLCQLVGQTSEQLLQRSLPDVVEHADVGRALSSGATSLHVETRMRH